MSSYQVRLLRPEARQVYVYNSGPTMFLFDEYYMDAIAQARPSLLQGYYGKREKDLDDALLALGAKGALVVFELYQDDEFQGEFSLGPPLSEAEADGTPWSTAGRAWLSLPSGTLCIDSMDTMRFEGYGHETSDRGVDIAVTPGDYILTVQCLDHEFEQDSGALVPEYYLTLLPLGGQQVPNQPFLSYPR